MSHLLKPNSCLLISQMLPALSPPLKQISSPASLLPPEARKGTHRYFFLNTKEVQICLWHGGVWTSSRRKPSCTSGGCPVSPRPPRHPFPFSPASQLSRLGRPAGLCSFLRLVTITCLLRRSLSVSRTTSKSHLFQKYQKMTSVFVNSFVTMDPLL